MRETRHCRKSRCSQYLCVNLYNCFFMVNVHVWLCIISLCLCVNLYNFFFHGQCPCVNLCNCFFHDQCPCVNLYNCFFLQCHFSNPHNGANTYLQPFWAVLNENVWHTEFSVISWISTTLLRNTLSISHWWWLVIFKGFSYWWIGANTCQRLQPSLGNREK